MVGWLIYWLLIILQPGERGTIKAQSNFNVSEDVAALRKAIEGIGTVL